MTLNRSDFSYDQMASSPMPGFVVSTKAQRLLGAFDFSGSEGSWAAINVQPMPGIDPELVRRLAEAHAIDANAGEEPVE